ncbi:MAG: SDR family oxidoreductase [Okeania sp. SIO3B3]|nr:SDR family oxidoreductase [Okeania sp. SIO3B3]
MFNQEFKRKVALVTGGSSGIGKASALALAKAGATVVVAGRRTAEGEQTVREICDRGGDAIFIKTDVSKSGDIKALIEKTLASFGRVDLACNNAGVVKSGDLTEQSEEEWDYMIDVNLKGTWLAIKHEIPVMLKQGKGAIVNIASIGSVIGAPSFSVYSASKGGIISLTRAAAVEYAKSNIRINAISPGSTRTPMLDNLEKNVIDRIVVAHPIGRIGQPEEIAEAVVWLCSDRASFITGHNLVIDGGYTAQ